LEDMEGYLREYLEEHSDLDTLPELSGDLDYDGRVSEMVDSAVPIYTKEIEDLWYLHKNLFEEAYENAGVGENPLENNGMTAIFCYMFDQLYEWYDQNAETIFTEWKAQKESQTT